MASSRSFQGRVFSLSASAQQVGNFLGPLVGGALAASISFRAVFPITAVLCLANLALVWRMVPNGKITAPDEGEAPVGDDEPARVSVVH